MDRLERARRTALALRTLEAEYDALRPAPASPRLDGMPRAQRDPDAALAALIDSRDALAARIALKRQELAALHEGLMPRLSALEPRLFAFCLHYYIDGATVEETARLMDRTERCVYSYKRRLAKALDDVREGREAG